MGRGRAKAKQTKVARQLKYNSGGTDLDSLRREILGEEVEDSDADDSDTEDYNDLYARYADFADDGDDGDDDEDGPSR